jgi:hypothetical protein
MICSEKALARQRRGQNFAGIIYAHQLNVSIGQCVLDLELAANASDPEEWIARIEYLPFK